MRLSHTSPPTRMPAFVLLSLALTVATCTTSAASLLRGQPTDRQLETVLDFPGVSINVNSNGETIVETPWGMVITGENGTSVHGPRPTTLGNLSCDTLGAWDTDDEPSCTKALPAFFNATATFGQGDKPRDRRKVMDDFCGTPCGNVWTAGVVAESLHCTPPGSQGQEQVDSNNIVDVSDGGVVVNVPGVTVNTSRGGGMNVQAPGTSVIRDPAPRQVQVEAPGAMGVDMAADAASSDAASTSKTEFANSLKSNDDKATNTSTSTSTNTTSTSTSIKGKPTYPADFPGLRMGCIKDKKSEEFCAIKRASIAAAASPACDFYLSCCYAQYARMFSAIPLTFVKEVEKACPGSTAFLEGDLCT